MRDRFVKFLNLFLIVGIVFSVIVVIFTFTSIYSSVSGSCNSAKITYGTDCVEAMILNLESRDTTIEQKNHSIWILGQLADRRALPVLRNQFTSLPVNDEPLSNELSQYELTKAIRWCENGNLTSWMFKSIR